MHTLLPPSQRDLWVKYNQMKHDEDPDLVPVKYAADPFVAKTMHELNNAENNKSKPLAQWEKYPALHISKALREKLEILIRSNVENALNTEQKDDLDSKHIEKILIQKGFRKQHVDEALLYTNSLRNALNWLCIHIPEDDLPLKMRPSDNKSIVLEKNTQSSLSLQFAVERLTKTGFPKAKCQQFLTEANGDEYQALSKLCIDLAGVSPSDHSCADQQGLEEVIAEEKEVLLSIFNEEIVVQEDIAGFNFLINSEIAGNIEFCISSTSKYPFELPGMKFSPGKFPAYIRLAIVQKVYMDAVAFIGDPMIYNLISCVEQYVPMILQNPPPLVELYQKGQALTLKSRRSSNYTVKSKVFREKSSDIGAKYRELFEDRIKSSNYQNMLAIRKKLPAFKYKEKICSTLKNCQILIISGSTGCGKSTQIPQFLLEDMMLKGQGSSCYIICTQPRRISATSLADRVAEECDDEVGGIVGYSIRGESKKSDDTKLLFCTTGVLLRIIQNDPDLGHISHVVIDEVHERGVDSDFLLILLRDLANRRKNIKIILMSATMEADSIAKYFSCSVIEIPGFAHPVKDIYLEDILKLTQHVPENINIKIDKRINEEELDFDEQNSDDNNYIKKLLRIEGSIGFQIDYGLIASTVKYICENNDQGAILIFLPGIMEIKKCITRIKSSCAEIINSLEIFPLHSSLTANEQSSVFKRMKQGKRKIVVSTNISETSVTM
jgi:ATP-dependent RNA helicase DHX57